MLVTSLSRFTLPRSEAVRAFRGTIVARAFGLDHPHRYSEWPSTHRPGFRPSSPQSAIASSSRKRFRGLRAIEDEPLRARAQTVVQALSPARLPARRHLARRWPRGALPVPFHRRRRVSRQHLPGGQTVVRGSAAPHLRLAARRGRRSGRAALCQRPGADRALRNRPRLRLPIRRAAARASRGARGHDRRNPGRLPAGCVARSARRRAASRRVHRRRRDARKGAPAPGG